MPPSPSRSATGIRNSSFGVSSRNCTIAADRLCGGPGVLLGGPILKELCLSTPALRCCLATPHRSVCPVCVLAFECPFVLPRFPSLFHSCCCSISATLAAQCGCCPVLQYPVLCDTCNMQGGKGGGGPPYAQAGFSLCGCATISVAELQGAFVFVRNPHIRHIPCAFLFPNMCLNVFRA